MKKSGRKRMTGHVMNILRVLHKATAEEIVAGLTWYRDSLGHVASLVEDAQRRGEIPRGRRITRRALAGMIAALSPNKTWTINAGLVLQVLRHRDAKQYKAQVAKAVAILDGADPLDVLNGPKERAFFECLADSDCTDAVTIDGHAFSVWIGRLVYTSRARVGRRLYRLAHADYVKAARQVGLRPNQLQAITWLAHRRIHNSRGHAQDKAS
jgi:hypothetical protein